jgi:hypothetical protein
MSVEVLHERARRIRARAKIRAWEARQRHHSKGVWYRLRRELAFAREVFIIDDSDAEQLLSLGYEPLPVGRELEPPKLMLRAGADVVAGLASARPTAVRLSAELLAAHSLVLIPFELEPRDDEASRDRS